MKITSLATACVALVLLSGCESDISDSVSSVLAPREAPRSKDFKGTGRAVFEAARTALKDMGYTMTHGGPAEGRIDAVSGISGGEANGSSRQISVRVRIEETEDGICTVTASFSDILEQDSSHQPGMATQTPIKEPALYQALFANIQDALREQAAGPGQSK